MSQWIDFSRNWLLKVTFVTFVVCLFTIMERSLWSLLLDDRSSLKNLRGDSVKVELGQNSCARNPNTVPTVELRSRNWNLLKGSLMAFDMMNRIVSNKGSPCPRHWTPHCSPQAALVYTIGQIQRTSMYVKMLRSYNISSVYYLPNPK